MLNKKLQALFLIGMLFSTVNLFSQCTHCSNPASPAEYGGLFNPTEYKNATLQLWAAKPGAAVDGRDWFKVKKAGDTTFVGSGDTLTVTVDTTCKYIARNINNCSCGGTYYSPYVVMANVTVVDSPSVPQYWFSYAPIVCSGSQTNIFFKTNSTLSGITYQYLRDDSNNVSGSITGSSTGGPLGITLTNKTGSSQLVRFVVRMFKSAGAYFDSKSFYVTVTPDSPSTGDHCKFPSKPTSWPSTTDVSTYARGAHVQFLVDTSVTATGVQWYKVLGTDTTYVGSGYSIDVTVDSACKYIVRNYNNCTCDSSIYYSDYTLVANYSVANSYVSIVRPLQYMPTIASGTGIDIIPRPDTTAVIGMTLYRDNAYVTGSTVEATSVNNASSVQAFDIILTNTTNSSQLVRYYIRTQIGSSAFGNTYTGYVTVLPSSVTAPSGNHCKVPDRTQYYGSPAAVSYIKNSTINLDLCKDMYMSGAITTFNNTADSIEWYRVRGPGDTVFVGSATPVNTTVDTTFSVIAVSRNTCYWSDSSLHIYKSVPVVIGKVTKVSGTAIAPTISNSKLHVCNATAANITATVSGLNSYYWYRSNKLVTGTTNGFLASSSSGVTINPTLTDTVTKPQTVYFVAYTNPSPNYNSQSITSVTVYPDCSKWTGLTTAVRSLKDSICAGDTATLTADTLPGYGTNHYSWSSGDTTKTIHPTTAGTYTVTVTNACGCTASASKVLVVKSKPTPTVNSPSICAGATATLTATGGASYLWSTTATTTSITTTVAGTYTVTATSTSGCSATTSGIVTINPIPTPTVSNDTVCVGDTATLHASGGASYAWSTGSAGAYVRITNSGIYSVTVSSASGCTASAEGIAIIQDRPNPVINYPVICQGGSAVLTVSEEDAYVWNTGSHALSISVSSAGDYSVTVTNENGCSASVTATVTVVSNPLAHAGADTVLCAGTVLSLGDSASAIGGTPPYSYSWSSSSVLDNASASNPDLIAINSDIYVLSVTDQNGCWSLDTVVVTVNSLPLIDAGTDTIITEGDSVVLGTVTYPDSLINMLWTPMEALSNPLANHPIATPQSTTTYLQTIYDSVGCYGFDTIRVTVLPASPYLHITTLMDTVSGVVDSFSIGDTLTISTAYINAGNNVYQDTVIIDQNFECDSCVHVRVLRIHTSGHSDTIFDPVFPIALRVVDSAQSNILIDQDIYLLRDTCLPISGCNGKQRLGWYSGGGRKSTSYVPLKITPMQATASADLTVTVTPSVSTCDPANGLYTVTLTPTTSVILPAGFTVRISLPSSVTIQSSSVVMTSGLSSIFTPNISAGQYISFTNTSGSSYTLNTPITFSFTEMMSCGLSPAQYNISNTLSLLVTSGGSTSSYTGSWAITVLPGNTHNTAYNAAVSFVTLQNPGNPISNTVVLTSGQLSNSISLPVGNTGTMAYNGNVTLFLPTLCSGLSVYSLVLSINGTSHSYTSSSSNASGTTYTFSGFTFPRPQSGAISAGNFTIIFTYNGPACVSSACASVTPRVNWGCNGTNCLQNGNSLNQISFRFSAIPSLLQLVKVDPNSTVPTAFPWESTCAGGPDSTSTEVQWNYVLVNKNPGNALDNIIVNLVNTISSYTYIRSSTLKVSTDPIILNRYNSNPNNMIHGVAIASLASVMVTPHYLSGNDFVVAGINPAPVCFTEFDHAIHPNNFNPNDAPLKDCKITIPRMNPGEAVVISFKTYRCCPSNNPVNKDLYFNQWKFDISAEECGHSVVSPSKIAYHINNPYISYDGSTTNANNSNLPNLGLRQDVGILPAELQGRPNHGCGSYKHYSVINTSFNTPPDNNGTDVMQYCQGVNTAQPVIGNNLKGKFKIDVIWPTGGSINLQNLRIIGRNNQIWSSNSAVQTTYPGSNTQVEAVFDMDDLALLGLNANSDIFKSFFNGSQIDFELQKCCTGNLYDFDIHVQTSMLIDHYTGCSDCWVPLRNFPLPFHSICPGCSIPGPVITRTDFVRTNYGFKDADNDGMPEPQASNNLTLQNITTPAYGNGVQIRDDRSMVGDEITSTTRGFLEDGTATVGAFTFNHWSTNHTNMPPYTTGPAYLDNVYLVQKIVKANLVGLSIGTIPPKVTLIRNNVVLGQVSATRISTTTISNDKRFVFGVAATDFNIPGLHFLLHDSFEFETKYTECTNPVSGTLLDVNNTMLLTPSALPNISSTDPLTYNNAATLANGLTDADLLPAYAPNLPMIYWCTGSDATHKVFRVDSLQKESWNRDDLCHERLSLMYDVHVSGNSHETNTFWSEYRPIKGVDPANLSIGLGTLNISSNTLQPISAAVNTSLFTGWSFTPASIVTASQIYPLSGTVTLNTSTNNSIAHINNVASGGWNYYTLNTNSAVYSPPFAAIPNLVLTSGVQTVPNPGSPKLLLLGDESFHQTFNFNMEMDCKSPAVTSDKAIKESDAYMIVPKSSTTCGGSDTLRIGLPNNAILNPSPVLGISAYNVGQPVIQITATSYSSNHITFSGTISRPAGAPNFILLIPTTPTGGIVIRDQNNNAITLQGVSVQLLNSGNTAVQPTSTHYGNYIRYDLNPMIGTSNPYYFKIELTVSSCQSLGQLNALDDYTLPLYYSWACNSADLDAFFVQAQPATNYCIATREVDAVFKLAVPDPHFTLTYDPANFTTCHQQTFTYCVSNSSGISGIGHMTSTIGLPLSVDLSSIYISLTDPTSGALVGSTTISNPTRSGGLYNIDLSAFTDFSSSSYVHNGGLIAASGTLCIEGTFTPNCHVQDEIPVDAHIYYYPVCDQAHSIDEYSHISGNILQDRTNTSSCSPILNYTVHAACHGGTGSITGIAVVGGTGTSTVVWTDHNGASVNLNSLPPSTIYPYHVVVTDQATPPCTYVKDIYIDENPAITIGFGMTPSSCSGTTGSLTVTPSGGGTATTPGAPYTYNWGSQPGSGSNPRTALGPGSYTVTVTDAETCTMAGTYSVTASGGINVTSTTAHDACPAQSNGSITLGLTGTPGYTYAWDNGGHGTSISNLATGTYHITVTDANQCTATATVSVGTSADCCTPSYGDLTATQNSLLQINVPISSSDFLLRYGITNFPGTSYIVGTTFQNFLNSIVINSTLTLDGDLTFSSCPNITFGPQGNIVVPNGWHLTIDNSNLYACGNQMWQGISASTGSVTATPRSKVIVMNNSQIRDALVAVRLNSWAEIDVSASSFISNLTGIFLEGQSYTYTGNRSVPSFIVKGTTFTSYLNTSGQPWIKTYTLPTNGTPPYSLASPNRGMTGIYLSRLPYGLKDVSLLTTGRITIGDPSSIQSDHFGYLYNGIYVDRTNATITNGAFEHISEPGTSTLFPTLGDPWNKGIYGFYTGSQTTPLFDFTANNNVFTSGAVGIHTRGMMKSNAIADNTFNGPSISGKRHYAIYIAENNYCQNFTIQNNIIEAVAAGRNIDKGIYINAGNVLLPATMTISGNTITTIDHASFVSGSLAYPTFGIDINCVNSANPRRNNLISGNSIYNAQYGTRSFFCQGLSFTQNAIAIFPASYTNTTAGTPKWSGAMSKSDQGIGYVANNIECNYNNYVNPAPANPTLPNNPLNYTSDRLTGIFIDASVGPNEFYCNTVKNSHWGIVVKGTSSPLSLQYLHTNTIDYSQIGVLSLLNGYLGNQGNPNLNSDNQWTNMPNLSSNLGVIKDPAAANIYDPSTSTFIPPGTFYASTGGSNNPYDPDPGRTATFTTQKLSPTSGNIPTQFGVQNVNLSHVSCATPLPTIDPMFALMSNMPLYEHTAQRLIQTDSTDIDSLYTRKWMELGLISIAATYPELLDSSSILKDTIAAMLTRPEWQLAYINYTMRSDSTDSMVVAHMAANAAITPINDWDANLKAVNELYLSHYALPDTLVHDTIPLVSLDDQKMLLSIATQCLFKGGPAVYQAQSLYRAAGNSVDFFDDVYCNDPGEERMSRIHFPASDSSNAASTYKFRLYPTLIAINGTFQTESSEGGRIAFYNALGQLLYEAPVRKGKTSFECKVLNCPNEMVLYKAVLDNGKTESGKIIIMK